MTTLLLARRFVATRGRDPHSCSRGHGRRARLRDRVGQALDRSRPILPLLPGVPERATHDYKRHGTSSLYAALDITTAKVIGRLHSRHRAIGFKKFMQTLDQEVRAEPDIHLVLDNASTHKTPLIKRCLHAHPRVKLHFNRPILHTN